MDRIFYFTGTGNCLMAARFIAAGMGKPEPELIRLTGETAAPDVPLAGRTVVVFPVYCGNAPVIVRQFVESLNIAEDGYFYSVATHGGHAVLASPQIASILNRRGIKNYKLYEVEMVHNGAFIAPVPGDEDIRKLLNAAYKRAQEIGTELLQNPVEPLPMADGIIEQVSQNPMARQIILSFDPAVMRNDFFLESPCDHCGVCEKACPMGNITLTEDGPRWNDKCQLCLACLQLCPKQAIQYVHNHIPDHTTVGKKRYRNPHVSLGELVKKG